jgi:hypothetical protein
VLAKALPFKSKEKLFRSYVVQELQKETHFPKKTP